MRNIELNFQRLSGLEYSIEKVFRDASYDWPGDWEGRALLAFCCHYEISKKAIPCMHLMMEVLPQKTNSKSYFGKEFDGDAGKVRVQSEKRDRKARCREVSKQTDRRRSKNKIDRVQCS